MSSCPTLCIRQCLNGRIRYHDTPVSSLHLRIAGLTLMLLILWGVTVLQTGPNNGSVSAVEIAVEHQSPAAITLTRTSDGTGIADIRNDSRETLYVSIPEEWLRDEVRGVPLSTVTSTEASLGFMRWVIPIGATVSFRTTDTWNALSVRNISNETMRLAVTTIDLQTQTTETESYLIDDAMEIRFSALKR